LTFRIQLCGGADLLSAAQALGLVIANDGKADLALIDLRDAGSVSTAAELSCSLPRVVVLDPTQLGLAKALGVPDRSMTTSSEPAALGPLIAAAVPAERRLATRSVLVTAARGGVGRSLLTANLARRIASSRSVLVLDLTGTGGVAWWLGVDGTTWDDLEVLAQELSGEHLAVVAAEAAPGLRVAGGPPHAPSPRLAVAAARASLDIAEMVLLDAPTLADERVDATEGVADRVLVLSYEDPMSIATLSGAVVPERAWVLASQSAAASLGSRDVFRSLPRDEIAVAAAAEKRGPVGGRLGRAYDELAELLLIDAS